MNTLIKMAWRNLWRNRRRTLITTASIVFSVLFACFMRSMQEGTYDRMIDNVVKFYSGYLQVQHHTYWDEKTLENSLSEDPHLTQTIEAIDDVLLVTPRLESFALSAHQDNSRPVFVMGILPQQEERIIRLSHKITSGELLNDDDPDAMISEGLARFLKLGIGDTLVMISQGYHGVSAAGKFAVKAIFSHPSPDLNNNMVFLSLPAAQNFYSAYDRYTSEVIMVRDHYKVEPVREAISGLLSPDLRVMTWDEMQPELLNMIEADRAGGIVMMLILYLVIGFGILGTVMMMLYERKREFGVINAIGMQKSKINRMVFIETILLGFLGALIGILVTVPFIFYFYRNPIPLTGDMAETMLEYGIEPFMFFSIQPKLFINQALIVFILCLFIAVLMMIRIGRMKMIKALRS
mgnify:CR=1 FL=1